MLKVKAALILAFIALLIFTVATSCKEADGDKESSITSSTNGSGRDTSATLVGSVTLPPDETADIAPTYMDEMIKSFPETLNCRGYGIYLSFGARSTLTVENFNRRVISEQLGLDSAEYTFVIQENVLSALRANDAYGGIGYGQEWCGTIPIAIRNVRSGEISEVYELPFILHKSEEADSELATSK